MLLSTGEQISIALCAMTIEGMGYQVVSLTGWQAGLSTDSAYSNARIKRIQTERIADRAGQEQIVHRHRLPGHQQVRRHHHPGPGRLGHLRGGAGGGAPCGSVPDLHRRGRRLHRRPPLGEGRAQAGGDHLRRDAGAGHAWAPRCSTTARWRWPSATMSIWRSSPASRKSRYQSQGGCQDHGKDPMSAVWRRIRTWPGWPSSAWLTSPASPLKFSPCWPRTSERGHHPAVHRP